MKVRHKKYETVFDEFPAYTELGDHYGYIVVAHDFKIYFFYQTTSDGTTYEQGWNEVTEEFEFVA